MAARDCKIETGQAGFESTSKRPEKRPWRVLRNDDLLFDFGDFAGTPRNQPRPQQQRRSRTG
jgi:hypothetical protein